MGNMKEVSIKAENNLQIRSNQLQRSQSQRRKKFTTFYRPFRSIGIIDFMNL